MALGNFPSWTFPTFTYHSLIAKEAYYLWEKDGSPICDGLKYWYEARPIVIKRITEECEHLFDHIMVEPRLSAPSGKKFYEDFTYVEKTPKQ